MSHQDPTRREALKVGSTAIAAALAHLAKPNFAFPAEDPGEELLPFLDMPRTPPNRLDWETLDAWITPADQIFSVQHYGVPEFDAAKATLEFTGLIERPQSFTPDQLKALPKQEQLMTLECSGNGSSKGFMNAVYNGNWIGTPLAPILEACGLKTGAQEVVFFGHDTKEETLRRGTNAS